MNILCCNYCGQDMECIEYGTQISNENDIIMWVNYCEWCGTLGVQYSNTTDATWYYPLHAQKNNLVSNEEYNQTFKEKEKVTLKDIEEMRQIWSKPPPNFGCFDARFIIKLLDFIDLNKDKLN